MTDKSESSNGSETSAASECALCLEPLDDCTRITNPWTCRHHFHNNCIQEFVMYNSKKVGVHHLKCPICDDEDHVIDLPQSIREEDAYAPYNNREYYIRVTNLDQRLAVQRVVGAVIVSCFMTVGFMYVINLLN